MRAAISGGLNSPRKRIAVKKAKNMPKPEPNSITPQYFMDVACPVLVLVYPVLGFLKDSGCCSRRKLVFEVFQLRFHEYSSLYYSS